MKRTDRIMLKALEYSQRGSDLKQDNMIPVVVTSHDEMNVNKTKDANLDSSVAPVIAPLSPLMTMPALSKSKIIDDNLDSPLAPVIASLTPHVTMPALSMSNIIDDNLESPLAPVIASLTPLVTMPALSMSKIIDNVDSPLAPVYSPLTPIVTAVMTSYDKGSSPLPQMSPSTLELFETLSGTFPTLAELDDCEKNTNIELIKHYDQTDNCKYKNGESDFSCDTDSDYVPDSDTDSDIDCFKKTNSENIVKTKNIPDSDSSDDNVQERRVGINVVALVHNSEIQKNDRNPCVRTLTMNSSRNDCPDIFPDEETIDNLITTYETKETDDSQEVSNIVNPILEGRPKRGRKRKYEIHTRAQIKKRKCENLPFHSKSKMVDTKKFQDYQCKCNKYCYFTVSKDERQAEFDNYVALGSYEAQLMFIVKNVKENPKSRSYTTLKNNKSGKPKPRQYSREYTIKGKVVCKDMFTKTFQLSSKKIDISLSKHRNGKPINDQRGKKQGGWNKTTDERIEQVKIFINRLPKYESHYCREQNNNCEYLKPGMTLQKIYDIYSDEFQETPENTVEPVSLAMFKTIFYKYFNLRFKSLKKDTCNRCDILDNKIKNCTSAEIKNDLMNEKNEHQTRAKELRKQMNSDLLRAKSNKDFECLTFDLEKTLPLPRIPTNIVFYKRQLWLYNSGIHVGSDDSAHCNVWIEGEAGRGAQEVGSCLVKFIKTKLKQNVKHLVLWSDCCGGQNRNIKIVLMLKAVLKSHETLREITLKYLESGHTFLPNDTDFSKIECHLKHHERIYTAAKYIDIMKTCRKTNPLKVCKMEKEDFLSTSQMEKKIVNRKISVSKKKINWLKTKAIIIKKNQVDIIYMKGLDGKIEELNIAKKVKGNALIISEDDFVCLWPDGKEIAQAKLDDLRSMYDLIPNDCLDFYQKLKGNINITEDIEGYENQLDFPQESLNNDDVE